MLDKSALAFLSEQAVSAADPKSLETDIPAVMVDSKIVTLERLFKAPVRHRARFTTSVLGSFIMYSLNAIAAREQLAEPSRPKVFVGLESMSANAFYDLGTAEAPTFSEDRARLEMCQTAEFQALLAVHNKAQTQKQLIDFLIDWAPCLTFLDADDAYLAPAKALAALRSITIAVKGETHNEERSTGRTRSAFEEAEAKSKDVLPAAIIFNAAPYLGLDVRAIPVRITINTEGEKPTITLRVTALEKLKEQLGEELTIKLGEGLNGKAEIFVGALTSTN